MGLGQFPPGDIYRPRGRLDKISGLNSPSTYLRGHFFVLEVAESKNVIRVDAPFANKLWAEATVISVSPPNDIIKRMLGAEFRMSEVTIDTDQAVTKNTSKCMESGAKISVYVV